MGIDFVEKFTAGEYKIGSFDSFIDDTVKLISKNNGISVKNAKKFIGSFPVYFRAAIVDQNNDYIGYITLFNVDPSTNTTSIRFEVNKDISVTDKTTIVETFKNWVKSSLNYNSFQKEIFISPEYKEEKDNKIEYKANFIMNNNLLISGIDNKVYNYFNDYYKIPDLILPFTIKSSDKVLGIVGLCNVNYHNRRANLCIYFDKNIHDDIRNYLTSSVIDDYIDYVHNSNIHNLTIAIAGHDKSKLEIVNDSKMNYFGYIPYGSINYDGIVESKFMFQHTPNMENNKNIVLPKNIAKKETFFSTQKKEVDPIVEIGDDYRLVSPKVFNEIGININDIIDGHINALKNRYNFSIPLGEDKYIFQKGNGLYGISKDVLNYTYILLDKNNNYSGYINVLRNNANKNNAEIEIGIKPGLQSKGLGKRVLTEFYDQLFSIGYASVTSAVFSFNEPSLKLHEKVAKLDGIRIESYYINGKLWDMSFYSKINDLSEKKKK